MSPHLAADPFVRPHTCETLEERLALTSQALSDLPDLLQFSGVDESLEFHSIAGVADPQLQIDYVRESYSFDGSGQTVAIIDSGIAWDHYALGGGFGEDFRVVGGWDFAENDGNPFDDGPAGFHGTHVAGIVGSDDAHHEGVAPGVDLVGLRVFDDQGTGKLEWVEQALQWVHDHRTDFANPITTVNLSLGINWNSNNVPDWATLEDEFAQLRKDGIFISVAAGNSFQEYLTKGVSYPAASSSVVPVASHGNDGQLSDFSQRNSRVIVAPGENVSSTIPAHLYGMSGPSSKFMATSGTSMAAPHLAGASVLLREALEIAGEKSIDQQTLYEHFQKTADEVYDHFTRDWYSRLDLAAAIEAALEDGHADQQAQATHLGSVSRLDNVRGILAKVDDVDYMKFVADESGVVRLEIDQSHDLSLQLDVIGQDIGPGEVQRSGSIVSFKVQAGQEYFVRIHGVSGQGNYSISSQFESSTPIAQDFGSIRSQQFHHLAIRGESFYRFSAARSAIMTVESGFTNIRGNLSFEILNAQGQTVATSFRQSDGARADFQAQQGETYVLRLVGNHSNFDLKFSNLVRTNGSRIIVGGTGLADNYSYRSTDHSHQLVINGTQYEFSRGDFDKIRINGGTGQDSLTITGSRQSETMTGGSGQVILFGPTTDVIGRKFEVISVNGNGGDDLAILNDSPESDLFRGTPAKSEIIGGGYYLSVSGFDRVTAISGGYGDDRAELIGSTGADFLHIHDEGTSLSGIGYQNYVIGFDAVDASGESGADNVIARGTSYHESFWADSGQMRYENSSGTTYFFDFSNVFIKSGGGQDRAVISNLLDTDHLSKNHESVEGVVFGSRLVVESYHDISWAHGRGTSPSIDQSAVDQVFDEYSQDLDKCAH